MPSAYQLHSGRAALMREVILQGCYQMYDQTTFILSLSEDEKYSPAFSSNGMFLAFYFPVVEFLDYLPQWSLKFPALVWEQKVDFKVS